MSGSALIASGVVAQLGDVFDIAITEAHYKARRQRAAKKWGCGQILTIRIEPAEEAAKHAHYKHLFGHYLVPASEETGYTVNEVKDDMKARFLPDGMTSLTEMSAQQFEEFNRSVEQCIREEWPEKVWDACRDAIAKSEARRVK